MTDSAVHSPFPTGASWLARALVVSAVLHALAVLVVHVAFAPGEAKQTDVIDIEIAPAPPKPEALPAEVEGARPKPAPAPEPVAPPDKPEPPEQAAAVPIDAGIDAGIDAPVDAAPKRPRPDAAVDAVDAADAEAVDAAVDAGVEDGGGAAEPMVAVAGDGGIADGGAVVAAETGSGSGSAGSGSAMETAPAVDGEPTTAGTAANLLAYFPAGHVVSALVRFDRLRGTEWAAATERVLEPLPDYRALFGDKHTDVPGQLDMLVISTPRPRDATATTLVAHTTLARRQIRELLAGADPITWSTARGGLLGRRKPKLVADQRVVLSPWKGWFVLAQPEDLAGLAKPERGNADTIEARAPLPPWLDSIRSIEQESGDDPARGPALIVTLASDGKRHRVPDMGVGVASLPAPDRATVAVELAKQGWLVRGNLKFASEADAEELVQSVQLAQKRIADSHLLSALLRSQHVYNAIVGLSLARTGDRVSYGTSMSVADARALLAAAAAMLDDYFSQPR
ncbi:MAG TPA: hypothetical protein VGF94_24570 [Kofleriaceae bacterium]